MDPPLVGVLDGGQHPERLGRCRFFAGVTVLALLPTVLAIALEPSVGAMAQARVPAGPSRPIAASALAGAPPGPPTTRPNIVMILADDMRLDDLPVMPTVVSQLADHGTTFTDAIVANTVCCPSRASTLTGEDSHTDGVYTNGADCHGSHPFDDHSTVATTLSAAGYRTSLVGKYRNSWIGPTPPPGWNDFHAFSGLYNNDGGAYYDYQLSNNGTLQSYGSTAADYSTDVLAGYADSFIRAAPSTQPFFLFFTPFGPHGGQKPAPRDLGRFNGMVIPHTPDFNEADVSDKPSYIQAQPLLDAAGVKSVDDDRRRTRETLLSVDDAVGRILKALTDTGRLDDTMIVFSSDQGLSDYEHRLDRKGAPYDEIVRVPFLVRYDRMGTTPRNDSRLVSNIDAAPTFADLAGTSMPGVDGRSLLPLLSGGPVPWRRDVLTEYIEGNDPIPSYCAVRTSTEQYVSYVTGETELYDLTRDPYELQNVAKDPAHAADVTELAARVTQTCSLTPWSPPVLGAPTRFVPVTPYRVVDTRAPGPLGVEQPWSGSTLTTMVAGTGSPAVPADAVAVAMNVTVTGAQGNGYVTVFPTGAPVPPTSTENFTAGTTAANLTVAALGSQGRVSCYVYGAAAHLVLDVTGYYVAATSATSGRTVSLPPSRILDTRTGNGAPAAPLAAGSTTVLQVLGRGGVPVSGASVVVLSLTAVGANGPGYVTAYPSGVPKPTVSNLNAVRPGQTRANLAVVPLGANGTISLFTSMATHLVADVAGYVTDASAPAGTTGLYVPIQPVRLRDTRVTPPVGPVPAGGTITVGAAGHGLPIAAGAAMLNVTATMALAPGFVTLYPAGTPRPNASNLNIEWAGETIPSAALVKLGGGAVDAYTQSGTDLILDATGYLVS